VPEPKITTYSLVEHLREKSSCRNALQITTMENKSDVLQGIIRIISGPWIYNKNTINQQTKNKNHGRKEKNQAGTSCHS
jgi:hypothetical protein